MLSNRTLKFMALFSGCLITGLVLGNHIIIVMSLIPLVFVSSGLIIATPSRPDISPAGCPASVQVGDILEIKYEITVKGGLGGVSIFQDLPPHFALVEGNNFRIFWKSWHGQKFIFACKIRCTKRGNYEFPSLQWEVTHALKLRPAVKGASGESITLTVRPKLSNIRRIRGLPGIAASPFPVIDIARIGVATTDFREIRNYVYGDPIKNINWKATARSTRPDPWPLINEYEVEGKKTVWIFQDASYYLEVGTELENAFEYCLEAANDITYYFIDRGYRVGMYVFNDGEKLFYPDAGKKQFLKISRELIDLKAGKKPDELPVAIEKCRRYILGYNPLCVVITGLDRRFSENIILGIKKLHRLRGRQKRKLPVMVINVARHNIIPKREIYDDNASILMQLNTKPYISQLRKLNASVLDWNPQQESFSAALLKQVKFR
jgi:uncharacterized protein (DUF58 family)